MASNEGLHMQGSRQTDRHVQRLDAASGQPLAELSTVLRQLPHLQVMRHTLPQCFQQAGLGDCLTHTHTHMLLLLAEQTV